MANRVDAGAQRKGRRACAWGAAAEESCAARYAQAGGRIVGRRVRTPAGELDLVVDFDDVLVVVEVKARRTLDAARAALSPAQARRVSQAAEYLWASRGDQAKDLRVDLVALDRAGGVDVIENALAAH